MLPLPTLSMPLFCNEEQEKQQQIYNDHHHKDENSHYHYHNHHHHHLWSEDSPSSRSTAENFLWALEKTSIKSPTTTTSSFTASKRPSVKKKRIVRNRKLLKSSNEDETYSGRSSNLPSPPSPSKLSPPSPPPPKREFFTTTIFHQLLLPTSQLNLLNYSYKIYSKRKRQRTPFLSFFSYRKLLLFYHHNSFSLPKILFPSLLLLFTLSTFAPLVSATPEPQKTSGKLIAGSGNGPHSASDIKIGK